MTSRTSYPLKLPYSMKAAAQRLAKDDGVSLNQWIAMAIAEKIGAMETAAQYLDRIAQGAAPSDLLPFLNNAKREHPAAED